MRGNRVIIATDAGFLAEALGEKLRGASFEVYTASDDGELAAKINTVMPRFVFVEHCFHGYGTDVFIRRLARKNRKLRIGVWAASEVKPVTAARFIAAGAESFFTLRDTYRNIEAALRLIAEGRGYCPAGVEAALDRDSVYPLIGRELTKRQIEISKLLIAGKSANDICDILSLKMNTVKYHKRKIYRKFGAAKTVDIMRKGLIRGIFKVDDFTE